MLVLAHRDAVRAGDEEGPLSRLFEVSETISLVRFLATMREGRFLPRVFGGRATWVVEGDRPLAVLAQEYRDAWPLTEAGAKLVDLAGTLPRPHLTFRYHGRRLPEDVFRELGGDPVRLGRDAFEASPGINWSTALYDYLRPRK